MSEQLQMLKIKFAEWIEERRGLGLIAETTARNYKEFCADLLVCHGDRDLSSLTPQIVTAWYIKRLKTCSASTVRVAHQILCGFFSWCVEQGALAASPMLKVTPPRKDKTERKALTEEEIRRLLDHVADQPLVGLAVRIALATGLRRGEIAALTWGDLDLSTGKLFVTKAIVRVGGCERVTKPKTASAVRVVSLPASLLGELRAISRGPTEPILLSAQGGRPSLAHLSRSVGAAMTAVGLGDGYCLHSARHSHATALLRKKMPVKAVSQRLGHSDVTTTLRTYAHVFETDDEDLAEAMEGLLA
jgi:integrase